MDWDSNGICLTPIAKEKVMQFFYLILAGSSRQYKPFLSLFFRFVLYLVQRCGLVSFLNRLDDFKETLTTALCFIGNEFDNAWTFYFV